jgi:hypothetical protein
MHFSQRVDHNSTVVKSPSFFLEATTPNYTTGPAGCKDFKLLCRPPVKGGKHESSQNILGRKTTTHYYAQQQQQQQQ